MSGKDSSLKRWEQTACCCALLAIGIAVAAVLQTALRPLAPQWTLRSQLGMRPITAVATICIGCALLLSIRHRLRLPNRRDLRFAFAALVAIPFVIGSISTAQIIAWQYFELRHPVLFVTRRALEAVGGRMSLIAGIQCCLLSLGLVALWRHRHGLRQVIGLTLITISLIALAGYAYYEPEARADNVFRKIAISAAISETLLACSLLAARPNRGVTAILVSGSAGGIIARRMLPAAVLVPLLLGWIQTRGQHRGYYSADLGEAMMAVSTVVILLVVTWLATRALGRLDAARRRALASVSESEERFRATFEQAAVGMGHVSTTGRWIRVNEKLCEIVGYSRQELLWLGFQDLTHPEDLPRDLANFHRALAGELDSVSVEKRYIRKDKTHVWVHLTVSLVRGPDGTPEYFIAVVEDISQRKHIQQDRDELLVREQAARAQAEAASRAKDQLLAVVSHELRTPLTPVLLMVSAMQRDQTIPEHVREDLSVVQEQVQRESELIEDLLDMTRISRGKLMLKPEPTDLHAIVREVAQMFAVDMRQKRLTVKLELRAATYRLDADSSRLRQVFVNLLSNAIKFTPGGGHVNIKTENHQPGSIRVTVSDSGVGIAPDAIARLFEPFEQAEQTVTRQFGGLGLGLSICKSLVQMHGGAIRAHSDGHGKGATLIVELPLSSVRRVEASPQSLATLERWTRTTPGQSTSLARPLRILIVEDNPATQTALARLARSWGHHVLTAGTASSAFERVLSSAPSGDADPLAAAEIDSNGAASEPHIDLLLCDIGLPDMSGWELMRQLRRRRPHILGLALSGFASDDDARRSRDAGFLGHLPKPVDLPKLESVLRSIAMAITGVADAPSAPAAASAVEKPNSAIKIPGPAPAEPMIAARRAGSSVGRAMD